MADLEKLLLEAAGRTNSRKPSGKDSDDFTRKNETSSQIPFKKRHEQTRSEEEEDSDVGSDLYKDDDDRKRLADMTELQREMVLFDRASKRDDRILKEKLRRSNQSTATIVSPPSRSSARYALRSHAMGSALSQLREKQPRQKNVSIAALDEKGPSKEDLDSDSDSGDDVSRGVGEPPSFEEVRGVTIRRSDLAKWLTEPFFEDLVAGCFVRIGIGTSKSGPVYRLCQVQSIEYYPDPETEYEVEGKRTRKYLVCFWGNESSVARWKMAAASDSPPTEEEFRHWSREADPPRAATRRHVAEKAESLGRARSQDRRPQRRSVNVAVEKDRLRRRLEVAEGRSDGDEAERLRGQLAELEASRWARERDEKAARLSEMNKRNRVENLKAASGGPGPGPVLHGPYDPFSRRWTRSRNYYEKEEVKPESVVGPILSGEVSELVMGPSRRKKESEALSGFEIVISEEILKSLGGHRGARFGFIARKQRIEATVGLRVLEDDGKRHGQTITVSDYNRRRGLL